MKERPRVFRLDEPHRRTRFAKAEIVDYTGGGQPKPCPVDPQHTQHDEGNLCVKLPSARLGDFVWVWGYECLLPPKTLDVLRQAELTGIRTRPVIVTRVRGLAANASPPVLRELVVAGSAGDASPNSGIRLTYRCEGCGWSLYSEMRDPSRLMDYAQWDGSDFFTIWPMPAYIFVTERVGEVLRAKPLSDYELTPIEELPIDPLDTGFGPGARAQWEERIRNSEPLA